MKQLLLLTLSLTILVVISPNISADDSKVHFSFGVTVQPSTWKGDNKDGGTSFDTTASQLQLNFRVRKGNYYGGLGFQGAKYDFSNGAPNKVNDTVSIRDDEATIERGEFDGVFGYYFWPQVSLFVDLKNITNKWKGDGYSLKYNGLGFGVSGYNPISSDWTFFGSLGFMKLNINADGSSIGDGTGSALVVGLQYSLSTNDSISISLKSQHNEYNFDEGSKQDHQIGGIVIGYSHSI